MNLQEDGYMTHPRWFHAHLSEFSHPAQVVYYWLYGAAQWNEKDEDFGTITTSIRDICEETGYHRPAVSKALIELKEAGLIEWLRKGQGRYVKSKLQLVGYFTPKTYGLPSPQADSKTLPSQMSDGNSDSNSDSNPPEQPIPAESPEPLEHEEHVEHRSTTTGPSKSDGPLATIQSYFEELFKVKPTRDEIAIWMYGNGRHLTTEQLLDAMKNLPEAFNGKLNNPIAALNHGLDGGYLVRTLTDEERDEIKSKVAAFGGGNAAGWREKGQPKHIGQALKGETP